MSIKKKLSYILITFWAVVAAIVCLAFWAPCVAAFAQTDGDGVAKLTAIGTTDSDVIYYCFDNPASVFADDKGYIAVGRNGTDFVPATGNGDITHNDLSADKIYRFSVQEENSEYLVFLSDGKLYFRYADQPDAEIEIDGCDGDVLDFDIEDKKIFALTKAQIACVPLGVTGPSAEEGVITSLSSDNHSKITAANLAVLNGKVYVAIASVFGNKQDICSIDASDLSHGTSGRLSLVRMQSDKLMSVSANDYTDTLYALTRTELIAYGVSGGGLSATHRTFVKDINCIYAFDDSVYALDSLFALHKFSANLDIDKVIVAAASDTSGFFNMPSGAYAKRSTLYVADTLNGRIATVGNDGVVYVNRKFDTPVSVAADNDGAVYVAYSDNKVGIFNNGLFSLAAERTVTSSELGKIKQIVVDHQKTLFILAENGIWALKQNKPLEPIDGAHYKAITLGLGKNKLYALSDDKLSVITGDGAKEICSVQADAVSVAVDLDEKAFILYRDRIELCTGKGAPDVFKLRLDEEDYTLSDKSGQLLICPIDIKSAQPTDETTNVIDCGNLIVLDTYRHRLLKTDGDALGARYVGSDYTLPDGAKPSDRIVRTVLRDAELFSVPSESAIKLTVSAGRRILVPHYELDETPEFAFVLVDDTKNNALVPGYVYKHLLSEEPIEYVAPPSTLCTVSSKIGTSIKRWPSRFAETAVGYEEVAENTKLLMLDFVGDYVDDYGYYWYKVALEDGTDGYITAVSVTTMDYYQANILPEYNAEIISYKNSEYAVVYTRDDSSNYVEIPGFKLKTGTKIEVVGSYDSSEQYTKIKFLDDKTHKTVTCYVKTAYVGYDGVNIVLLAAIIVIAVTVILAIIIIARTSASKRKKLEKRDDPDYDRN